MENILAFLNPWWRTGKIKSELAKEFKRSAYWEAERYLNLHIIIGLYGLRRTGKSTIFFQLMDSLLSKGVKPEQLLYFTFDEKVGEIKDILASYSRLHSCSLENGQYYVFLDEVQKLEDWSRKIKLLYDLYPNIKFFVSGSAQLLIRQNVQESLGGRIKLLKLEPLAFAEWLALNQIHYDVSKLELYREELEKQFLLFRKAPFPEIACQRDEFIISSYLFEMVLSKALSYDIPKIFPDAELPLLELLKTIFYEAPGFILNVDALSRDLGKSKEQLLKHIFYLEQAMVIRILRNYRGGKLSSSRKMRRIYPYHSCFVPLLAEDRALENLFVALLGAEHYWREKEKEVDIIKGHVPIEVKWKAHIRSDDLKHIFSFFHRFTCSSGILVSKEEEKVVEQDGGTVEIIPAWKAALTLEQRFETAQSIKTLK